MTRQTSQFNNANEHAVATILQYMHSHFLPADHPCNNCKNISSPQINTSLKSKIASAIGEDDPKIFKVIENGREMKETFNKTELENLNLPDCDLVFNATQNTLQIKHLDDKTVKPIDLTKRGKGRGKGKIQSPNISAPGGSILEILRIMMENPRQRFTERIISRYTNKLLCPKTFNKYIERLRDVLGDKKSNNPFILTDNGVELSISKTGSAYYLNPDYTYRVIRYIKCR